MVKTSESTCHKHRKKAVFDCRSRGILFALCLLNCSLARASSFIILPSSASPVFPATNQVDRTSSVSSRKLSTRFGRNIITVKPTRHSPSTLSIRGGGGTNTQLSLSPTSFDNAPFFQFNRVMLAANALWFVVSLISGGSHLHLDLLGTGAFAIAAIPTGLASSIPRVHLSAACVSLCATELASFLFFRALKT